jgi:parallel beta-helix repeat protein
VNIPDPPGFTYGAWYTLKVELTAAAFRYYINGSLVYTDTAIAGSTKLLNLIVQAYNFGDPTLPPEQYALESYDVYWDNIGATSGIHNQTKNTYHLTLQDAVTQANPADVIAVASGTYSSGGATITVDKALTISGADRATTFIDVSGNGAAWGIRLGASNITFRNFTIIPATAATNGGYPIHVSAEPVTVISNITVEQIVVNGSKRTGVDVHGVDNAVLRYITSTNATGGNGLQLTGCVGATLDNITTTGNAWGGIAVYNSGPSYLNRASANVAFDGTSSSIAEGGKFYTQEDYGLTMSGITAAGYLYKVRNETFRTGAAAYTFYQPDATMAVAFATGLPTPLDSYIISTADGSYLVGNGMSIQTAVIQSPAANVINVLAGTYPEEVDVSKSLQLLGAGMTQSVIIGPKTGGSNTLTLAAGGVVVDGFTITRDGNTVADWPTNAKNQGVLFGQGTTGSVLRNCLVTGNRNGVYLNNTQGHTLRRNVITFNRTGIQLVNDVTGLVVEENEITDNWTLGILYNVDAPGLVTSSVSVKNNSIAGNWYSQLECRWTNSTAALDHSGNWYGTASPFFVAANAAEPGYATQIPVAYGGTAVNPGTNAGRLGGVTVGRLDVTPWLNGGADSQPGTAGFQGDFSNLWVTAAGAQTGGGPRIQEGITLVSGSTVNVAGGFYGEAVTVNKANLRLLGEGMATTTINPGSSSADCITLAANGLTVSGFTLTGGRSGIEGTTSSSKLSGLMITGNALHGIRLVDGGYSAIQSATIVGHASGVGVLLSGAQQVTVSGNTLQSNGVNVQVELNGTRAARGNLIQGNTLLSPGTWSVNVTNEARSTKVNFNVFGAPDKYIRNSVVVPVLNAQYNWFGGEAPPQASDFSGGVDYTNWYATDPTVSVFPSTYYLPTGTTVTMSVMALLPAGVYARGVDATLSWTNDTGLPDVGDPVEGSFFGSFPSRLYLFDRPTGSSVRVNSAILGTTTGAGNPTGGLPYVGTVFSQDFDALTEGSSSLTLSGIQLRDPNNVPITPVVIDPPGGATLIGDGTAPVVAGTFIDNTTLDNDNFVKNTDNVTVTATVTDASALAITDITADLSGFYGGTGHTADNPSTYVGDVATWTVAGVVTSPTDGPVTVTVTAVDAATNTGVGSDNITADNTAPTPVTDLVAKTVSPGGHQQVSLTWTAGTDANYRGARIRYNGWSYPSYPGVSEPVYPATGGAGTGVSGAPLGGSSATHVIVPRNVYYYSAFAEDWAGNVSSLAGSATDRSGNYYLGDLGSGTGTYIPGSGGYNGQVNYEDLYWFSRLYFSTSPGWTTLDPNAAEGDVGPTLGNKTYGANHRFGIPRPDGRIDFEDLMIFSMNYNSVAPRISTPSGSEPSEELAVELSGGRREVGAGEVHPVVVRLRNPGQGVKGTSVEVVYDRTVVELTGVRSGGVFGTSQQGFFGYREGEGRVRIDCAVLGVDRTVEHSGDVAVLEFRGLRSGESHVRLESGVIRDGENASYRPVLREEAEGLPTVYGLSQNYPNPFNPVTVIEYALPAEGQVELKVFDALGREVATLVNEVQRAGYRSVSWSGENHATGVYYYRLRAGEYTEIRRMVLVK